jgi:hypothetical protein
VLPQGAVNLVRSFLHVFRAGGSPVGLFKVRR